MAWAAIGVGLGALSLGLGVAQAANQGKGVQLDNGAGIKAEAETLPWQRQMAAAQQQGGKIRIATGRKIKGQPEIIEADFTGYSDAEIQAKLAEQMAQIQLELGEKYGQQFIAEAKKQLELADPQGVAAREKLFALTQEQAARQPVSPIATLMHQRMGEELAAGNRLTERAATQMGTAADTSGAARGGRVDKTLLRSAMESGLEGDARKARTIQKGLGWLTSGATPEDVRYRSTQQNLANLSNFTQGRTPTSQFASLSTAQRGAAPMTAAQPGPQINPGVSNAYNQVAISGWNTQLQNKASAANPWMAGLSTLLSGVNVATAAKA